MLAALYLKQVYAFSFLGAVNMNKQAMRTNKQTMKTEKSEKPKTNINFRIGAQGRPQLFSLKCK